MALGHLESCLKGFHVNPLAPSIIAANVGLTSLPFSISLRTGAHHDESRNRRECCEAHGNYALG